MSHLDQARAAVTKITDAAETGKVPGVLAAGDRGSHLPRVEILQGELDAAVDLHRILADAEDRRNLDTRGPTRAEIGSWGSLEAGRISGSISGYSA